METNETASTTETLNASGGPIRNAGRLELLKRSFPLAMLVLLIVIFSILSPRFLTFGNLLIVLQQGTVLLVAALGMTFVIMAGSIDRSRRC
ncbi:hypothetical protein P9273_14275 [Mesorhizobium sp. WSM4935]|uniref:hypothetical protein n=1 Tax=Mesorhizobium sp. WSM4935 TaxID=3038547 RepID=UPI0024158182|nr:hypothetical protein [Mesorhizobium sp. WSM4935]MDG4876266.1 hypothetical protein [Mesorhizobium sp. WSM4935]